MVETVIADREGLSGEWRMDRIFQEFPSAHRALSERYRITRHDGADRAGYRPPDSLATVAADHGFDVADAIEHIERSHELAQTLEITVQDAADLMKVGKIVALDVRETRAFAMANIPGSKRVDDALAQDLVQRWPRDTPIVLVCHHGMRSLDAAAFLRDHGFTEVKSLKGGVDAWSVEIDPSVPRY